MSDLLIRGIEMPKDGHWGTVSIPFYIHGDGSVSDSKGHVIGSAVPVPPHGRLIDKDALEADISASVVFSGRDENAEIVGAKKIINRLHVAPTIIPAEHCKEKGE